jgi:hypothetical protein
MQKYSAFFETLHDETSPTGAYCSVLRAVVFHDPMGTPMPKGQNLDFAFSAVVKPRWYLSLIAHTPSFPFKIKCCVDQLRPPRPFAT